MPRIIVVGGGISGLALAFRLRQRHPGYDLVVLEKEKQLGGKVQTIHRDGFRVEAGPNGFLNNKTSTMSLCNDLGLQDQLISASDRSSKKRYLFLEDRMHALPSGLLSFLTSDLLTWRGKLKLILERFHRSHAASGDESIDAFARRRVGAEVADVLVDAIITGIHAGDPKLLSLAATFPHIAEHERRYGSVTKGFAAAARERRLRAEREGNPHAPKTQLWSLRCGLSQLIEALQDQLRNETEVGVSATNINRDDVGWTVKSEDGREWRADAVVLACPAYQQAAVVSDFDPTLADRIGAIAYNRVAVVALGFRRDDVPGGADGFGYIAPQRTRRDLLGVQWCSSIFDERAPSDAILMRAMAGGWHRPDIVNEPDEVLTAKMLTELRLAMGIRRPPIFRHIVRWNRAIPQYHIGHGERVAWIQDRVKRYDGLFVGGNAYHGVALNDCTAQAEILCDRISQFFEGNPN